MSIAACRSFFDSFYRYDESDRLVWALDAADPGPKHRTHDFH